MRSKSQGHSTGRRLSKVSNVEFPQLEDMIHFINNGKFFQAYLSLNQTLRVIMKTNTSMLMTPESLIKAFSIGLQLSYKIVDKYLDRPGMSEQHHENIMVIVKRINVILSKSVGFMEIFLEGSMLQKNRDPLKQFCRRLLRLTAQIAKTWCILNYKLFLDENFGSQWFYKTVELLNMADKIYLCESYTTCYSYKLRLKLLQAQANFFIRTQKYELACEKLNEIVDTSKNYFQQLHRVDLLVSKLSSDPHKQLLHKQKLMRKNRILLQKLLWNIFLLGLCYELRQKYLKAVTIIEEGLQMSKTFFGEADLYYHFKDRGEHLIIYKKYMDEQNELNQIIRDFCYPQFNDRQSPDHRQLKAEHDSKIFGEVSSDYQYIYVRANTERKRGSPQRSFHRREFQRIDTTPAKNEMNQTSQSLQRSGVTSSSTQPTIESNKYVEISRWVNDKMRDEKHQYLKNLRGIKNKRYTVSHQKLGAQRLTASTYINRTDAIDGNIEAKYEMFTMNNVPIQYSNVILKELQGRRKILGHKTNQIQDLYIVKN